MEKIEFQCEVITPMFCHGAYENSPEIRPATVKGLLRFWWRSANGHMELAELRKRESEIFGSSDDSGGRSSFNVRVKELGKKIGRKEETLPSHKIKTGFFRNGKEIPINILDYLAFGVVQYKKPNGNIIIKDYIKENSKFNIIVSLNEKYKDEIMKAFYLLFEFGNIGSKARNGFGGINLLNKEILPKEYNIKNIYCSDKKINLPDYTAFSKESIIYKTQATFNSWDDALANIGIIYREARLSLEKPHHFDERQYVSLPLIAKGENGITTDMQDNRKSKSYFLKVIKENNKYRGQILFLPSTFEVYGNNENKSFENYKKMNKKLSTKMMEEKLGDANE